MLQAMFLCYIKRLYSTAMKYWLKLRFGQHPKLYLVAIFVIFAEANLIIFHKYIKATRPIIKPLSYIVSDMSCHYAEKGDALPSAEDPSFSPKGRSIFFHETSCRGGLTSRQACSVETAARAHPQLDVYVLFSAPVTKRILKKSSLAKLQQFQNVKLARVHIAKYSKGTLLESFPVMTSVLMTLLEDSQHPVEHVSNILRIVTLHKWGGIYLDTDMLVTRSLENLPPNWIVRQVDGFIPTGILSFAKDEVGINITTAILKDIISSYDPLETRVYAPRAIQKVIQRICPNSTSSEYCADVKVFPYELFYPLHYTLWKLYFKVGTFTNYEPPYTYHMWNHLSIYEKIEKDTPYDMLAKKHCPTIYELYGDEFGL